MMKRVVVFIVMAGFGFLIAWALSEDTSQQKAELETLKAELLQIKPNMKKSESENSKLEVKLALTEQDCKKLQEQVTELTESRDELKRQIEQFTFSREQSRQQLEEIIKVRDGYKNQIEDLISSNDKLQKEIKELNSSQNQLQRQIGEQTRLRNAAVAKAKTAQERIDILLALVDTEKKEFRERQAQDQLSIANQPKEDAWPPVVKVSEDPNVLTEFKLPTVVNSEVIKPVVMGDSAGELPKCHSFSTSSSQIKPGQSTILSWHVSDADRVRIKPEIGVVNALGSMAVKPSTAITYTLIATNQAGECKRTCRIEIGDSRTDKENQ